MTYAKDTDVPVERSKYEIERTLARYGADRFGYFSEMAPKARASIVFECKGRRLRFDVPLPGPDDPTITHDPAGRRRPSNTDWRALIERRARERWRALLLCVKAKLESVESGIETFDDAFLAHVVLPTGETVGEHVRPAVAQIYATNSMQPLLPPPPDTR